MLSLRRITWLAVIVVGLLLGLIITFGIRQNLLSSNYGKVIEQSEAIIFHFVTVRESITESLIDKSWDGLEQAIPEMEELNSEFLRLQENSLVPAELKLAMVDKVDLAGIVISLRRIVQVGDHSGNDSKELQEQLRFLADSLFKYNRIIVSHARSKILDFQLIIIGSMGVIISLATFALILLYRNSVVPILRMSKKLQAYEELPDELFDGNSVSQEVTELFEAIRERLQGGDGSTLETERRQQYTLLAEAINETTNQLNGMINYAQLLHDDAKERLMEEERDLLMKIIEGGVEIAEQWQNINKEK